MGEDTYMDYDSNNMNSRLDPCSGRFSCRIKRADIDAWAYISSLEGSGCFLSTLEKNYKITKDISIGKVNWIHF